MDSILFITRRWYSLDGVLDNLENALRTWADKLAEIWNLLTQDPETFRGGTIWNIIQRIHGSLQAIGLALLVLFFLYGVVKQTTSLKEIKRPEMALRLFLRFAIARALANDPDVLLCDEATSALDPQTTKSILELIRRINQEFGITVIIITHAMSVVRDVCDTVAVIEKGRLVRVGDVEEVMADA